jgi:hypothetical protein
LAELLINIAGFFVFGECDRRERHQRGEQCDEPHFNSPKTFNECLMEAPCSAWKRVGSKGYQLNTKIIFRGNPVEGETISGGTMGEMLETKCGKK